MVRDCARHIRSARGTVLSKKKDKKKDKKKKGKKKK